MSAATTGLVLATVGLILALRVPPPPTRPRSSWRSYAPVVRLVEQTEECGDGEPVRSG